MRRLCFGGSFNPIHHGHLICARAIAERCGYDRIVLIPSAQPPHKPDQTDIARPMDRLTMCKLASAGAELYEVSDIEMRRGGPSYTIQTVRELREAGWDGVDWLIGADMLAYLPQWQRPLELIREVNFIIMARPGWQIDWASLPPEYRHLRDRVLPAPLIDISGTLIRERIRAGLPIDFLTPPPVCQYIHDQGLYQSGA